MDVCEDATEEKTSYPFLIQNDLNILYLVKEKVLGGVPYENR